MEIEHAVLVLKKGGIIIFPTETLYGIGAIALFDSAVSKVFKLKKRPLDKTVPVIIGEITQLSMLTDTGKDFPLDLIEKKMWPGPLSILFPARENLPKGIVSKDGFVCVRLTSNKTARKLCIRSGYPLVATSANISGTSAPASLEDIDKRLLELCDFVVKSGEKPEGKKASTIIKFLDKKRIKILRQGAYSFEKLKKLGLEVVNIGGGVS